MLTKRLVDVPYAIFEVNKNEKMTDFDKVREKIESLTNEEAGGQKNIVDKEIVLTVYSANSPDLTVIDLPGITRNPVGDQPKNIEEITRNMAGRCLSCLLNPLNQILLNPDS